MRGTLPSVNSYKKSDWLERDGWENSGDDFNRRGRSGLFNGHTSDHRVRAIAASLLFSPRNGLLQLVPYFLFRARQAQT